MDKIFIRELALRCIIGIYPEERREKQDIVINLEMHCDPVNILLPELGHA